MIQPAQIEYGGVFYEIRVPTGADWLAVAPLEPHEKSLVMVLRCTYCKGVPAWSSMSELEVSPMPLLLAIDSQIGQMLEYDIADPTSAKCADCPEHLA